MKIESHHEPFPYLIVHDFYEDHEVDLIWNELNFWSVMNKLLDPERTGQTYEGKKKNKGVFLDDAYTDRSFSNILQINRKIFSKEIIEAYWALHPSYKIIGICDKDTTLVSYYEDQDYYKPHADRAAITALTWFYKEPKMFEGGDLVFTEYDITISVKNNMMLVFPSVIEHAVTPTSLIAGAEKNKGLGRYCISNFMTFRG